jgi:hypothetical protein
MAEAIKIEFPQEQLQTLVEKWVLDQITPEQRNEIVSKAVAGLLGPRKDNYGRVTVSPLEEAFNQAVTTVMHKIVREMVENNEEAKAKIAAMVGEALHSFFMNGTEYPGRDFHTKMAEAFSSWFHERTYS